MDLRKLSKIKDAVSEIQIPTKQELIEHFSKLAQEIKENPHWEPMAITGNRIYILDRESNLGEWETIFQVSKDTHRSAVNKPYSVWINMKHWQTDNQGLKYDPIDGGWASHFSREQLEQNWESILEEAVEYTINELNDDIRRHKKSSKTPTWVKKFKRLSKGMPYQVGEFDGDVITVFISGDYEGDLKGVKNEWMRKAIEADNAADVINADRWNPSWDVAEEALGEVCNKLGLELEVDNVDPEGYTCYVSSGE